MSDDLQSTGLAQFGGTATKLSRTPLGIIALFIVLVYALATLVLVVGHTPASVDMTPLVWFMVGFPCLVFGGFVWLVANKPKNLYGPGDFSDAKDYLQFVGSMPYTPQEPEKLAEDGDELPPGKAASKKLLTAGKKTAAAKEEDPSERAPRVAASEALVVPDMGSKEGRIRDREKLYEGTRKTFLVHVLRKSAKPNQRYDIGLYVMRHDDADISDIRSAEFFLGKHWGNRIIMGSATPAGNRMGISTSAFGPFLCTCLVTFTDGEQVMLYRYVDFEMGPVVEGARVGAGAS